MPADVDATLWKILQEDGQVRSGLLAKALGITRQAAHRRLRALVDAGKLVAVGAGRSAAYHPARGGPFRFSYDTQGLEEDRVWEEVRGRVSSLESLEDPAASLYRYAFTELVNNVIDHAQCPHVEIVVRPCDDSGEGLAFEVIDEGVGVFAHVRDAFELPSALDALQELTKGKTTTDPERHSGDGLFFVSKAADLFRLESGKLAWIVDNERDDYAIEEISPERRGTRARFEARPHQARALQGIFDEYTDDFVFSRTKTVIKLFAFGTRFISRSEAKRLTNNLERFTEVVLDFRGVDAIGQGFADEVFRVWARAHPETALRPIAMNEAVNFMVERSKRHAPTPG